MSKKHIIVAGNIGAGKSTLVEALASRLGFIAYYEPVRENPYLEDFYFDMNRWAFHSQLFFLTHRVNSHRALGGEPSSVVQDRSIYEDAQIFARNLYLQRTMSERDWTTYSFLYSTVIELLPPPDAAVYIRAGTETLRERIRKRGRGFEESIETAYLENLNHLYEDWIGNFRLCPVIMIDGDRVDFVNDPRALEPIAAEVERTLTAGQQDLFEVRTGADPADSQ